MQYQEIENLFTSLFERLSGLLSEVDMTQPKVFFDAGEYGIALETLIDTLDENEIEKTPSIARSIERLKEIMEL
ncbi:MafI family immunity protein [Massilia sp. GCM10023247]|uniref:MafI family immunity protein n=1 Tax=Massilia sp. GCM10023247 TaxID=3252643 RepID=UPI00361FD1F7